MASNQVNWSKHKTKLGDPVKTLAEAINTALLTAFGKVINTDADEDNPMAGSLAFTSSTLTLSSGSVTATRSHHVIAAETGTTDDLDTIAFAGSTDTILLIEAASGDTITVKHNTGSSPKIFMRDDQDKLLTQADGDRIWLKYNGTDWAEIVSNTPAKATQADMEAAAATTRAVTPARQHFHPGHPKMWGSVSYAAGVPTLDTSYNLTSIGDTATGDLAVTIATDFSSANWVFTGSVLDTGSAQDFCALDSRAAGTCDVRVYDSAGGVVDPTGAVMFMGLGDQ